MNSTRHRPERIDPLVRKKELLRAMLAARESILIEVEKRTPDQIEVKYLGSWSVMELLAHLTGWDLTNLMAIQSLRQGHLPDFYNHRDPDWRTYNAMLVDRYLLNDLSRMVTAVKRSFAQLMDLLESIDPLDYDRDWGVRYKGYRVTIARLLESETRDEQEHASQLSSVFPS